MIKNTLNLYFLYCVYPADFSPNLVNLRLNTFYIDRVIQALFN